jgi:hypothetical protein
MFAFTNELPRAFELRRVRVWVDGALRHDGAGPFAMPLLQGTHDLSLAAEYQVKDPFFSYMRGYRIALRSAERVEVHLADAVVTASAIPAGGVTTPMARRAQIVWR